MKNKNRAFSLAELMIILLIFSIILAASMPVITRKRIGSDSYVSLWRQSATDTNDVYPKSTASSTAQVLFGVSTTTPSGDTHRVIIDPVSLPYALRVGSTNLMVNNKSGFAVGPYISTSSISDTGVLLGYCASAQALGTGAISMGCANGSTDRSIAIGNNASVSGVNGLAIGRNAKAGYGAVALGTANATDEAVSLLLSNANGHGSFAAGEGSVADGTFSVALGQTSATATGAGAVAIGSSASAVADNSIAIGPNATDDYSSGGITIKNNYIKIHGTAHIDGNVISPSDVRLKNVGSKYSKGINYIDKIQPYNFDFKKDKKHTPQVGVMAQDLQKVFPNSVTKLPDTKYLSICKEEMFYAMINSIKYLHKSVNQILANLNNLDKRLCILTKTQSYNSKRIEQLLVSDKNLQAKSEEQDLRIKKLERKIY